MSKKIVTRSQNVDPYFKLLTEIDRVKNKRKHVDDDADAVSKICKSSLSKRNANFTLFVTNRNSANEVETIRRNNIVAVLTLGKSNRLDSDVVDVIPMAYKLIDIEDCSTFDNMAYIQRSVFPISRKFIQSWLQRGNVLIHCMQGMNRSPLVALDYLLNVEKHNVETAVDSVLNERSFVFPERSLLLQTLFLK